MKRLLLVLVFALANVLLSQGVLKTEGTKIVDSSGKEILLKGVNFGNWLVPEGYMFEFKEVSSPWKIFDIIAEMTGPDYAKNFFMKFQDVFISELDVKFVKECGFNSIRIPFNYKLFNDEDYLGNTKSRGFELIDRVVNWAKKYDLYVVLDMHCAPGGQTGANIDDSYGYPWLMVSKESQDEFVKIWTEIAEYYKNEEIIAAYELINEPIAHYFEKDSLNPILDALYNRTVKAIREVDDNHIIVLGGSRWNGDFTVFANPLKENIVYAFHKYWMPPVQKEIQDYVDFRDKYNVPVWMSESGENEDDWVFQFRTLLDSNNIGWSFWPFKKIESTRGPMQYKRPENYEKLTEYAVSDRSTYEKIRDNRPDYELVKKALEQLLNNCKYENCKPNKGFLKALGVKVYE